MAKEDNRTMVGDTENTDLKRYLQMHRALGNRMRYKILWLLVQDGEMSPGAIEQALAGDDDGVKNHIETLCDAFLIERWEQTERGTTGTSTVYGPTVFGRVALTDGIHELISAEKDFREMYDSDYENEGKEP